MDNKRNGIITVCVERVMTCRRKTVVMPVHGDDCDTHIKNEIYMRNI